MKKSLSFLLFFLIMAPLGLTAADSKEAKKTKEAKYRFEETVYVPLPENKIHKWKLGLQKCDDKKGTCVTRYILESETTKNWTQLLNIQFKDKKIIKLDSAIAAMQDEQSKSKVVNHKVHFQNPHDILFEREFPTGEHELVRMIMTKKGLHRIAYIKRGPLSKEERVQWIDRLSKGMIGGRDA